LLNDEDVLAQQNEHGISIGVRKENNMVGGILYT